MTAEKYSSNPHLKQLETCDYRQDNSPRYNTPESIIDLIMNSGGEQWSFLHLWGSIYYIQETSSGHYYLGARGTGILTHEEAKYLIGKIQEFYALVDPVALLELKMASQSQDDESKTRETGKTKPRDKQGWVYLLSSNSSYKIGITTRDVARRVNQIQKSVPFPIMIVHTVPSDSIMKLESDLHQMFADKRQQGEWFSLSPDEVAQCIDVMNMRKTDGV